MGRGVNPSAQGLADDLDRWLRHEPIQARPSTAFEHVHKWVRRRPTIAALAAGLTLALILGAIGVTDEWRQAVGQRRRADENAASDRQHLYGSDMAVAWNCWAEGDAPRTRDLLMNQFPAMRQGNDLRGFEWRYLWGRFRPDELFFLRDHCYWVRYSPDGRILAGAGSWGRGVVTLWDVVSLKVLRSFKAYEFGGWRVAFSSDGKVLATSSRRDPDFKLWDVATGAQIATLTNRSQENFSVTFSPDSPDGQRVATVACKPYQPIPAEVKIWDVASRRELTSLPGLKSWVGHTGFSPNAETLATGDGEGVVRLWNLATGNVRLLTGHTGFVFGVRFSPDGKILATGDENGTIILWDWVAGGVLGVLLLQGNIATRGHDD